MSRHIASTAKVLVLLLLFTSKVETGRNGRHNGQGSPTSSAGTSSPPQVALPTMPNLEELKGLELQAKEMLTQRSRALHVRLHQIEETSGQMSVNLSEPELRLLAMARSHNILRRAVELQIALDAVVRIEDDALVEALGKISPLLTNFGDDIQALRTIIVNRGKPATMALLIDELIKEATKLMTNTSNLLESLATFNAQKKAEQFRALAEEMKTVAEKLETAEADRLQKNAQELEAQANAIGNAPRKNIAKSIVAEKQSEFDRTLQALARMAIQNHPNPFLQMQIAQKVLELASTLRQSMSSLVETGKLGEVNDNETTESKQNTVRLYNEFARKLERLDAGLHRNLYGQFNWNDIELNIEEAKTVSRNNADEHLMSVLEADFWTYILWLIQVYRQLELPQMDEVKLRAIGGHVVLCIGLIEYDYIYTGSGTRRRKFREDLDEYTSDGSMEKAAPLKPTSRLVNMAEADRVFFAMVQHGWDGESYGREGKRFCLTFVWNFLCQLFDGECPKEENMPANFVELNKDHPSVFSFSWLLLPNNNYRPRKDPYNCALKRWHHEIVLQLDRSRSSELDERNQQMPLLIQLPPVVEYTIGKYRGPGVPLADFFSSQEQAEEIFLIDEGISGSTAAKHGIGGQARRYFKAKLTVYVCDEEKNRQKISLIEKLHVFDQLHQEMQIQLETENGRESEFKATLQTVDLASRNNQFHIIAASNGASSNKKTRQELDLTGEVVQVQQEGWEELLDF